MAKVSRLKWPHQYAGGTFAAEGKHGYSTERMAVGYYDIQPVSWPTGRHRGYQLHFVNDRGALAGGLWQSLGLHSSPNKAKGRAQEHYGQLLRAKNLEGWRDAPPAAVNPRGRARARVYRNGPARGYRARYRNGRVLEFRSSSDAGAVAYARGLGAHKAGSSPTSVKRATIKKKMARRVGRAARNPVRSRGAEAAKAARALEDFTGHRAKLTPRAPPKIGRAGWVLGKVASISYIATRDGETAEYVHPFRSRSRPQLVSSADGSQLYLLGGAYSVTDRGIEDTRS